MTIEAIVKRMRNNPADQREMFHRWCLKDDAEGQLASISDSDYKPAVRAMQALTEAIYREMAKEEIYGVSCPWSHIVNLQA